MLTSIAGLVHVNDLNLTTQILVPPCHICSVYAIKEFGYPPKTKLLYDIYRTDVTWRDQNLGLKVESLTCTSPAMLVNLCIHPVQNLLLHWMHSSRLMSQKPKLDHNNNPSIKQEWNVHFNNGVLGPIKQIFLDPLSRIKITTRTDKLMFLVCSCSQTLISSQWMYEGYNTKLLL